MNRRTGTVPQAVDFPRDGLNSPPVPVLPSARPHTTRPGKEGQAALPRFTTCDPERK